MALFLFNLLQSGTLTDEVVRRFLHIRKRFEVSGRDVMTLVNAIN